MDLLLEAAPERVRAKSVALSELFIQLVAQVGHPMLRRTVQACSTRTLSEVVGRLMLQHGSHAAQHSPEASLCLRWTQLIVQSARLCSATQHRQALTCPPPRCACSRSQHLWLQHTAQRAALHNAALPELACQG